MLVSESSANGDEVPMPTLPADEILKNDVVAEPAKLVDDATSNSGKSEPGVPCSENFAIAVDVPTINCPSAVMMFDAKKLVVVALELVPLPKVSALRVVEPVANSEPNCAACAYRLVEEEVFEKAKVEVAFVDVLLPRVTAFKVVEPVTNSEPSCASCANRLVEDAVCAKL